MLQPAIQSPSGNSVKVLEEKFLSFFKPKPIPVDLVRVGGSRDGAYLVPEDLNGIEACFSPGVANYKTFEDELANVYAIKSHMIDFSARIEDFESPLIDGMQTFSPVWLREQTSLDSVSLGDWISKTEPAATGDFLLQMDIEGGEYEVIESSPPELLDRFRILVIEFHDVRSELDSRGGEAAIFRVIERLSPSFVVAHVHPNNCCGVKRLMGGRALIPEVMEVTLLRKDRFAERKALENPPNPRIPHPLDIGSNVPNLPPVFLDASWSSTRDLVLSFPWRIGENLRFLMSKNFWFFMSGKVRRQWRRKVQRPLKGLVDFFYWHLVVADQRRKSS